MVNNDYRTMFNKIIGPILNYSGFFIDMVTGIIQKKNTNIGITLSGRNLYVPIDGADQFAVKDSAIVVAFSPFKILEHILIISKVFCDELSSHLTDELDEEECNSAGEVIPIVSVVKRGPKDEDQVPATFNGVIYEIWCRNGEEVLGKGISYDGNDIKAIIMAMIDTLSKYSNLVEPCPDFDKIFRYIDRVESAKDKEFIEAKAAYSKNISQIDFSDNLTMDDAEIIVDEKDDEGNEENDNKQSSSCIDESESVFDDIEF